MNSKQLFKQVARALFLVILVGSTALATAQPKAPKWTKDARKSLVKITTFDAKGVKLHEGLACVINEQGEAISNLSLFQGCDSAVATDYKGKDIPVDCILGASDLYDAIRFHLAYPEKKKATPLTLATVNPEVGQSVTLLDYSTDKKVNFVTGLVNGVTKVTDANSYYTLALVLNEKQTAAPLFNEAGELFALAQQDATKASGKAYGVSATFVKGLSIGILSLNDKALNSIGIAKDLPATEEQALAQLYLAASAVSKDHYFALINRYIARYPEKADGFQLRAAYYTANFDDSTHLALAEVDMAQFFKMSKDKDLAYYTNSRCMLNYVDRHDSASYKNWSYVHCLEELQKAIAIKPAPIYYQQQAEFYTRMKEYQKAYESYEKVNASNIASAQSFYAASRLQRVMRDTTGLIMQLMDSCINHLAKPYTAQAAPYLFERGELNMAFQNYVQALADYEAYESCASYKPNAFFYYKCEQAAVLQKNYDKALYYIDKALALSPKDALLNEERGGILVSLHAYVEAIKSLDTCISIQPIRPYVYRLKGYALLQIDRKAEAKKALLIAKEQGDEMAAELLSRFFKK
ncbi:MAG: tetratricopeptide repeat protein [Bacteroidaceae bacterium]